MRIIAPCGVLVVLACVLVSSRQNRPEPTGLRIRTETNYIEVDAHVTDARGVPLHGLEARDFELFDEGMKQDIEVFDEVHLPDVKAASFAERRSDVRTAESDIRSNLSTEGRIYLVVFDDLHISQTYAKRVKTAIANFVDRVIQPNDLTAIVYTSGRSGDGQDFTGSLRLLHRAIDNFTGMKLRSPTVERLQDERLNRFGVVDPNADPQQVERAQRSRTATESLERVGILMGQITGRRKTLLFVSEGPDYEVAAVPILGRSTQWSANAEMKRVVGALNRANITVYALDPRGVSVGNEGLIESSSLFEQQGVGLGAAQKELQQSRGVLEVLAANTGGATLLWRNDSTPGFDRIREESGNYYLIGYHAPPAPANVYRRITVTVRRSNVRVHARSGYVSGALEALSAPPARNDIPTYLARALASPLPMPQVPMSMVALPYRRGSNSRAAIGLDIDVGQGPSVAGAKRTLEVVVAAVDRQGRTRKIERQTIPLPESDPDQNSQLQQVWTTFELPPGAYLLRAVASTSPFRVGSVSYDLELPDYPKQDLSMSGVSIATDPIVQTRTTIAPGINVDEWPGPLTTRREFAANNAFRVSADVYARKADLLKGTEASVVLRSGDGSVVQTVIAHGEPLPHDGARRFVADLVLPAEAGSFVLRFEARAGRLLANQDIPITIRGSTRR